MKLQKFDRKCIGHYSAKRITKGKNMQDVRKRGLAKPAEQLVLPCLFWLLFLTKKKSDKGLS